MSLITCLRKPQDAASVVVHASNKRTFGLISALDRSLEGRFGVYAIAPPGHSSPHQHLESLVQQQLDELTGLVPTGSQLFLMGDCLAGHMTLKMTQHLTSTYLPPPVTILLDTTPTYRYFEANTAFNVLKLPGSVGDFGALGAGLLELDASLERQYISPSDWAKEIFPTVCRYRSCLAGALTKMVGLDGEDGEGLAVLYLNWAKLVSITLVSPGICFPGPVTLLASVEAAVIPLLDVWQTSLPNIMVRETATPHADIMLTPAIRDILAESEA